MGSQLVPGVRGLGSRVCIGQGLPMLGTLDSHGWLWLLFAFTTVSIMPALVALTLPVPIIMHVLPEMIRDVA